MKSRYYTSGQFDSKDLHGSGENMQQSTINLLDDATEIYIRNGGTKLTINSGYRTKQQNEIVKGSPTSSHLKGYAVDISCNPITRSKIIKALQGAGFERIGIGATFLHADNDPKKNKAIWYY